MLEQPCIMRVRETPAIAGRGLSFGRETVLFTGRCYRRNGQHSREATIKIEGNMPDKLVVHVDTYEVENKEALANLFQQFDRRWSSRTAQDIAGAYWALGIEPPVDER